MSRPNAPYHSIYLGAPFSAPASIKSKSNTKFSDAITTTKMLNPILNNDEFIGFIIGSPDPKKLIMKLIRYKTPIPAVAANIPNLKFSVGAIIFVL